MSDNQLASIIWDYMKMGLLLKQVDAVIILGSHDEKVPIVAADLFKKGLANLVVCTGGLGSITKNMQTQS